MTVLAVDAATALGSVLGVLFILFTVYVIGITVRGEPRVCAFCDRTVSKRATVCAYCGRDLP